MSNSRARLIGAAGAAIVCGGAAASIVQGQEARVRAQVGPLVPVVVAAGEIPKGKVLTTSAARTLLVRRRVPARFVPPNALRDPSDATGFHAATTLSAGDYVTSSTLVAHGVGRRPAIDAVSRRARLVEVSVSGGASVLGQLRPGSLVDVLVTSDRGGPPRTFLALQRVELVQAGGADEAGSGSGGGDRPADAVATLHVSLRQAVLLTAAQNFAREVRLVPRPDGDRRTLAPIAITAAQLRP